MGPGKIGLTDRRQGPLFSLTTIYKGIKVGDLKIFEKGGRVQNPDFSFLLHFRPLFLENLKTFENVLKLFQKVENIAKKNKKVQNFPAPSAPKNQKNIREVVWGR